MNNRQAFALEVSIAKDENYLAAFDFVKSTVDNQLGVDCEDLEKKRERLKDSISKLEYTKRMLEEEVEDAKKFRDKVKGWMTKVGLNYEQILEDGVPF